MFCASCSCELPTTAKFCVRCGSAVEPSTSSTVTRFVTAPTGNPVDATFVGCLKCSGENPSDYSFCTACGASLAPVGSPVFLSNTATAFGAAVPRAQNEPTAMEAPSSPVAQQVADELRGVGGWLLFFCIGLIFVTPLIDAADILKQPTNVFVVVFDLGLAAFAIYTGVTVWRIQPNALKVVKIYFIVIIVVAVLTILASIFVDINNVQEHSASQTEDMIAAARSLGYVAIWWSYFGNSKRVKATFGSGL